jgi:hypothetical protein
MSGPAIAALSRTISGGFVIAVLSPDDFGRLRHRGASVDGNGALAEGIGRLRHRGSGADDTEAQGGADGDDFPCSRSFHECAPFLLPRVFRG